MKYYISILLLLILGCAPSSIKLNTKVDDKGYQMFGRIPERNFYLDINLKDSLSEKWESEVNGSFTSSSVTFSDSSLFINDLSGRITSFNISSGKRTGQIKNEGTVFTAPVIHKYLLIYADALRRESKSFLNYYDFSAGKNLHSVEIDGRILSQLIKTPEGIIFLAENGLVGKYNFLGKKIWETETNAFAHTSPALSDNRIIFGNDRGEIICINNEDGSILFRKSFESPFFGNPSISEGFVYIGNDKGSLFSIDIFTGEVNWRYESGTRIIANPVVEGNNLLLANLNGNVYKLNKKNASVEWTASTMGIVNAAPLVTNNIVIIPDHSGKIYFIEYATGRIIRTLTYPARVRLSPVIISNFLFVGYDKGILKAYEIYY